MLEYLKGIFTPENVALIVGWFTTAITLVATVCKLASSLKALKEKNDAQATDITNVVVDTLNKIVDSKVNDKLNQAIKPVVEFLQKNQNTTEALAKIIALSQENTPESRVAILDIIAKMNVLPTALIESAKQDIADEVEAEKQEKENTNTQLESLKVDNNEQAGRV